MTIKAQFSASLGKQGLVLRGVGFMTRTTLSLLKGDVLNKATSLEIRWFMALVAEAAAFSPGFERFLGCGGVVAPFTVSLGNKRVCTRPEEFGLQ
jgi:hypothetical protein